MAGPEDETATAEGCGRGGLRASDADREQVIDALKAAFVQGRLTEDEHDARAAQASASRSRGELAALTADLPTDLTARLPKASYALTGVCVVVAAASVAAAIVLWQPDNYPAFALALSPAPP